MFKYNIIFKDILGRKRKRYREPYKGFKNDVKAGIFRRRTMRRLHTRLK